MTKKQRSWGLIAFCLLLAGGVFLVFSNRKAVTPSPSEHKVKVGYLPIYVDLPLFVAQKNGLFQKRGIEVELQRFEASPEMGTALLNRNIDAAASIATSVALSTESRDPNKVKIFLVDAENKSNYLSSFVVLKDSGITKMQSLKGKTIGSFPGPTAKTYGKMVLEKYGLDPEKDVQWVELAAPTHLSALETKTVDALFTYEPVATQAVMEKNAIKLLPAAVESTIIDPWQAGVWVISNDFAKRNPTLTKQFVAAIYDAVDFMRKNPEEAKKALADYTKIKPEVALKTPNIPFTKLGEVNIQALQKHTDILTERKVISKRINVEGMFLSKDYIGD